ncbi:hypothetical protein DFO67_10466 [Modicisalibacter xianhensis]|uniref:Uncharacterized protein n=1 Tax=Modicisalibacter xianhensis TaxID=442341 RepID=A0A4V3GUH1_9GAMM|nr:hypothetical protein DFO67_10466 [Halomonas xianhensis]
MKLLPRDVPAKPERIDTYSEGLVVAERRGISKGMYDRRIYQLKWSYERAALTPRQPPRRTPPSELSAAARRAGLTYGQMRWRVRDLGLSIDEAIAYKPMTPAESGRLGGKTRWNKR